MIGSFNDLGIIQKNDLDQLANNLRSNPEMLQQILLEINNISRCVLYDYNNYDISMSNALFSSFHTINGLSIFIKSDIMHKIAMLTENLIYLNMKSNRINDEEFYFFIKKSSEYLSDISLSPENKKNSDFLENITGFIQKLENKIKSMSYPAE